MTDCLQKSQSRCVNFIQEIKYKKREISAEGNSIAF